MKKLIYPLFAMLFLAACGNDTTTKSETDSKGGNSTPAVENVNGNVPDTTNSISTTKPLPTDSSHVKDSTQH